MSVINGTSTCMRSSTEGFKRTLLYKNTKGYDLGPVSRDKRYIALVKRRTTSDADIFLYDRTAEDDKEHHQAHRESKQLARRFFSRWVSTPLRVGRRT